MLYMPQSNNSSERAQKVIYTNIGRGPMSSSTCICRLLFWV